MNIFLLLLNLSFLNILFSLKSLLYSNLETYFPSLSIEHFFFKFPELNLDDNVNCINFPKLPMTMIAYLSVSASYMTFSIYKKYSD